MVPRLRPYAVAFVPSQHGLAMPEVRARQCSLRSSMPVRAGVDDISREHDLGFSARQLRT
jgi:hypothetical protein